MPPESQNTLSSQLAAITEPSIECIAHAAAETAEARDAIRQLLRDDTERFKLLDQSFFQEIIMDAAGQLDETVVCYVRVRKKLLQVGIHQLKTAIYLTHVWLNYRKKGILPESEHYHGPVLETVDILRELNFVKGYEKFELLAMSGNYYLFLMAFFEDYFHEMEVVDGRPSAAYYEAFARISFRAARDHGLSEEFDLMEVCHDLSENFATIKTAISSLRDEIPATEHNALPAGQANP